MTIYEQIKSVFKEQEGKRFSAAEIKNRVSAEFGTNEISIIPSDYCYNRINNGIPFNKHLFIRLSKGEYKYIGENHPYTGWIHRRLKRGKAEEIAGRWENGSFELSEAKATLTDKFMPSSPAEREISQEQEAPPLKLDQIETLYEEYLSLLKLETCVFGCEATETRHLIGRIGEFKSALETQGSLAKRVNQAGFDVISPSGRKISVKTTAQKTGFVSFNRKTTHLVDDLMVIQFKDGDFAVVFHDSIDVAINHSRIYKDRYEFDIGKANALWKHKETCYKNEN